MKDKITAIDRYENSPEYGKKVLEQVYLWRRPGAPFKAESLRGVVKHGDAVEILDKKQYKRELWCKIVCNEYPDEQRGWLKSTLLEKEGGGRPGIRPLRFGDRLFVKLGRIAGRMRNAK